MSWYRVTGLLVVAVVLGFAAGRHVGKAQGEASARVANSASGGCDTCALPSSQAQGSRVTPAPKIPTGSGLPCLVEFGSDECRDCQRMKAVLDALEPRVAGRLDIVRVDTDVHRGEAQRFRLRLVPTQVLVDATGAELWRHEGFLPLEELQAVSRPHLRPATQGPPVH